MNILLCGAPLAGKSFFGRLVAQQLNWTFIDTDQEIEKYYQTYLGQTETCRNIFQKHGALFFRQFEHQTIQSQLNQQKQVIALGGGALTFPPNLSLIKEIGSLIYLEVETEVLVERLLNKLELPAYLNPETPVESFKEIVEQRKPFYEKYSDVKLSIKGLSIEEVVMSICTNIQNHNR